MIILDWSLTKTVLKPDGPLWAMEAHGLQFGFNWVGFNRRWSSLSFKWKTINVIVIQSVTERGAAFIWLQQGGHDSVLYSCILLSVHLIIPARVKSQEMCFHIAILSIFSCLILSHIFFSSFWVINRKQTFSFTPKSSVWNWFT